MTADERHARKERRLRQAAVTASTQQPPAVEPDDVDDDEARSRRFEQRTLWLDQQVRRAIERGDFDNLPGAGKPLPGLDGTHDPDWWVKRLIAREQISAVLPPALALRKEDAELDARIDVESTEDGVRRLVDDFNRRVVDARRQLLGGPPVITLTREIEREVERWAQRRAERRERLRTQRQQHAGHAPAAAQPGPTRRWWWRRER
jgi:hypothetical protein